jgi:bifunctional NMN adenylyltransferase/nudix hydrolase
MSKQYDTIVFIGRFQPIHNAHLEIVRRACELANELIIIVGSSEQPLTFKNPWTFRDRKEMWASAVSSMVSYNNCRIKIVPSVDFPYNDQMWASHIQDVVNKNSSFSGLGKIAIIGHKKDESSFYLDMFPQWHSIAVEAIEPLDATSVRDLFFRGNRNINFLRSVVPPSVCGFLERWSMTPDCEQITKEREFTDTYKRQFESLPYPPVFVTTDAVVLCCGHVLMIKRRSEPGKGLMALPGGFLSANKDKSMLDCAVRELREETGLKVPVPVLKGCVRDKEVFDAIDRSARGRTITHAFKIVLGDTELPKVKGGDDAEKAMWIPLANVDRSKCFEDHYSIIQWAIGG